MSDHQTPTTVTPASRDFARFHLDPKQIAPWEDGARTDGSPGTFEWWYFDAHLDDGAKLVVIFFSKPMENPRSPVTPQVTANLDLPDGRTVEQSRIFASDQFSAATEHCEVRIGDNRFQGDLHTYTIHVDLERLSLDATLVGSVPSWRPGTGFSGFGDRQDLYYAWLPSVPRGEVTAAYTVDGVTHRSAGAGYHDHNWGNVGMMDVVHDWYWARGAAGPYTTINTYVVPNEKYGYNPWTRFFLARDDQIVAQDDTKVRFERLGLYTDEDTHKPVANVTRYTYTDGPTQYTVTYTRYGDLLSSASSTSSRGRPGRPPRMLISTGATSDSRVSCVSSTGRAGSWSTSSPTTRSGSSCTSGSRAPDLKRRRRWVSAGDDG